MEISIQILVCTYVNWCSSCSEVIIETAVNVSTVDWDYCTDTRQYNMTVTNSDSVVLYRNSTTCCLGNLTVHYNIGNGTTPHTLLRTNTSSSTIVTATGVDTRAQNTKQTDRWENNQKNTIMNIQVFLCSYLNWCSQCDNVIIETAVSVKTVDWSGCTDTIQYNMAVTNSDSVVLYRNSTTCCTGNLTIHYNGEDKSPEVTSIGLLTERFTTAEIYPSRNSTEIKKSSDTLTSYKMIIVIGCAPLLVILVICALLYRHRKRKSALVEKVPCHYEDSITVIEESRATTLVGGRLLTTTNNYLDLQRTVEFSPLTSLTPTSPSSQYKSKEYENMRAVAKQGKPHHGKYMA